MIRAARLLTAIAIWIATASSAPAQVIPFFGSLPMVPFPVSAALPAGCSQATTYLARTSGGNEGGNTGNVTTLICGLVTDGVITGNMSTTGCGASLDALYILAQQNSTDAVLNLCGTNYSVTLANSPPFTSYTGYGPFGATSSGLVTNFNSTTATSPNFTQNSASFGFWAVAATSEAIAQMGNDNTGATGDSNLYDNYTGSLFYARVTNNVVGSVANPGTKGLFVGERPNSSTVIPYWDGVAQTTQSATSQTPYNGNFFIGYAGSGTTSGQTLAEAHIGAALGATLNLALYNRLRTYMTAVGVP